MAKARPGKDDLSRCTPEWIRTIDLDVRNVTLYPTELRAHTTAKELWLFCKLVYCIQY